MADAEKLVLFDLVSTITDAGPRYAEAYVKIAKEYNLPIPEKSNILDDLGQRNLKEIIRIHSPELEQDRLEGFMNDCNHACDTMLYDVHWIEKLFDHVRESLSGLKGQGYRLGLYTGTREDALYAQLNYHNLQDFFDAGLIRGKDNIRDDGMNTQELKAAQIASIIAAHGGVKDAGKGAVKGTGSDKGKANDVVVIGDTLSDFQAAMDNQARFIGFAETPQKAEMFRKNGVTAVFSDYRDLSFVLEQAFDHKKHGQGQEQGPVNTKNTPPPPAISCRPS